MIIREAGDEYLLEEAEPIEDIPYSIDYRHLTMRNIGAKHFDETALVGTFVPRRSKKHDDLRGFPEYNGWRDAVFKRDNYICQECGGTQDLEAHHIKQVAFYPNLAFDVDNGETLCVECHSLVPRVQRSR